MKFDNVNIATKKRQLIKRMRFESNKAMSKIIANTFDQNERNKAMLQIQALLAAKTEEVKAL